MGTTDIYRPFTVCTLNCDILLNKIDVTGFNVTIDNQIGKILDADDADDTSVPVTHIATAITFTADGVVGGGTVAWLSRRWPRRSARRTVPSGGFSAARS